MATTDTIKKQLDDAVAASIAAADKAKVAYEEQTQRLAWETEAYKFLSRAPGFPNSTANAVEMRSILASLGLPWSAEAMERIWGDAKFRGRFASAPPVVAAPAVAAEPEVVVDPDEGITAELIQSWDREQYKAMYQDKHKRAIVDRVLRRFSADNPGVDASRFNRGSY